ncbi:MAG: phosphoesterase PA-phosphatase related protein [Acidobacteria bacterium]|nr:phosphoesterase PA-phosphatase related protein [Acidobacteriota bacterium]
MQRQLAALSLLLLTIVPTLRADDDSKAAVAKNAVVAELERYGHDIKDIALAPAHWDRGRWIRFAEGTAAVAALYAADKALYRNVQDHRTSFTDDFAKAVTPFGGRRAENISALLILAGAGMHDDTLRDAGRDSLESEIIAGGIVTPLLKRAFGRARPIQDQGTHSFTPFSSDHQSFPSGHATNAFAFATAIAAHYDGWVVPTVVYTLASGVAFSRVNDRAHYPSDVLAGALIGRAIAKGVVHRHRHGTTTWLVTPAVLDGKAGVVVHITR